MMRYFSAGQSQDPNAYVPLTYAEAQASTTTTTTSSTYSLLNTMTSTPISGIYQVWFSASFEHSGSGVFSTPEETYFSIYVDGVAVTHSERVSSSSEDLFRTVACQCRLEVNGTQAVEVRWRTTGGTATCHARTLSLFKLSDIS